MSAALNDPTGKPALRTNYVLIDFESVQPEILPELDREHFRVVVFVGASQARIPFETAEALQRLGAKAEYVKIAGNGPNALDFHIAYHIGRIAERDPSAFFHVVSKDKGFDPLIVHLKDSGVFAARSEDVAGIPLLRLGGPKSARERAAILAERLVQLGSSKPRRLKTLVSTIHALFQKALSEEEATAVVAEMERQGLLDTDGVKVSYKLPGHG